MSKNPERVHRISLDLSLEEVRELDEHISFLNSRFPKPVYPTRNSFIRFAIKEKILKIL